MTSHDDPLDDGRETFENLVRRVAAHPIAEAKDAIAGQLFPVKERLGDIHDAIEDLGKEIEKHHQGDVRFQESAREQRAALRSGQDELRGVVDGISAAIEDLGEEIEEHHRGDVRFQVSAREEFAALRSGQDELRGTVHGIGEELAGAERRLATAVRYLAALYVLLTVALGIVVVLLVTET